MKIDELNMLNKMCDTMHYVINELCDNKSITMAENEFTVSDYEKCVAILAKEKARKARTNKRTADYIANKRKINPNYAR